MLLEIVYHLAEGLFLWLLAYMVAPAGYEISLSRGIAAAVLTTITSWALPPVLKPLIGDWHLLAAFLAFIFIVKLILRLSFWRSTVVVVIVTATLIAFDYFVISKLRGHPAA